MKKVLKPEEKTMEKIVALCKNRGYVYPGSEIYGGLSNSWDYGPLGLFQGQRKKRVETQVRRRAATTWRWIPQSS